MQTNKLEDFFHEFTQHVVICIQRVTSTVPDSFNEVEETLRRDLLPALFGCEVSDQTRNLTELPIRFGGMAVENPAMTSMGGFVNSQFLNEKIVDLIANQSCISSEDNSYRESSDK